jgi:HD-GYP domain-containing protein (c-di-GMP phosphodiesterase class II)
MKIRLRVLAGENPDSVYSLGDSLRIGRDIAANDIVLNEASVSREHAVLTRNSDEVTIISKGRRPVLVDGIPVIGQRLLHINDVITICSTRFVLEAVSEPCNMDDTQLIESMRAGEMYARFMSQSGRSTADSDNDRLNAERLKALYEWTQLLSRETSQNRLLDSIGEVVFRLMPAHNMVILLKNPKTGELEPQCIKTRGSDDHTVSYSHSLVQRSFDFSEAMHWTIDAEQPITDSISQLDITSALCAPLEYRDRRLGVIYVDARGSDAAFTPQYDLEFVAAFARSAAIVLCNIQYLDMLHQSFHDTLIALSNAIEMRDHYTIGHTWRVTRLSIEIARDMELDASQIDGIEMGGTLHDVGKIAVPDNILTKPAALDDNEFRIIMEHPQRGARMLEDVESLRTAIPCVLYHHEKWDGTGYPFGLKGEAIPLEGRIIAIADAFDAMTSDRPYRKGMGLDIAIQRIMENSGTQLDPSCVAAFMRCNKRGVLQSLVQAGAANNGPTVVCPYCSTHFSIPASVDPNEPVKCHICHRNLRLHIIDRVVVADLVTS